MAATRIAPTPSGFLHEGNLVNFATTARLAKLRNWQLGLRIDDADHGRVRPEYVEDIYRCLDFLNITPHFGPADSASLTHTYSQAFKSEHYWNALSTMAESGALLFVCNCSRTELEAGNCVRNCNGSLQDFREVASVIRIQSPQGDVVMWRRDNIPAYHLTNIVDDRDLGITYVVRGEDLRQSSELHAWLIRYLPEAKPIKYFHHPLLTDAEGVKLSKSQGTSRLDLTPQLRERVDRQADRFVLALLAEA